MRVVLYMIISVALVAGCRETETPPADGRPGEPSGEGIQTGPIDAACDLLTPKDVASVLESGTLRTEETTAGIGEGFKVCRYFEGGDKVAEVTAKHAEDASMLGGAQGLVDLHVTGASSEPVDGLGDAAAYYSGDLLGNGVVFVVVSAPAATQFTVESEGAERHKLIELAGNIGQAG